MRMLLINPTDPRMRFETDTPNLGLGYIASSLRRHIRQSIELRVTNDNIAETIKSWKPNIVGITSVSQGYNRAMRYARIAKSFGLPVIVGGVHISSCPQSMTQDMDVAVIGEGEHTIVGLISHYIQEGKFNKAALCSIDGIAFKENGKLVITKPRELIQDMDSISYPARDILKIRRMTNIMTSRGCPYRCTFCLSSKFWGHRARFHSAEYVVEEIGLLYRIGVKEINISDDLVIADEKRLGRIIELLGSKNLLGKITYSCSVRSNLVTDSIIEKLCTLRTVLVAMGIETGCQRTLEYLKGKSITVADHVRALKLLSDNGIAVQAGIILGSPHETREEFLETLKFIKNTGLTRFFAAVLTPFPGTTVWEYAKSRGLVSDDMDWDRLNENLGCNSNPVILSEYLSEQEIRNFHSQLMAKEKQYHTRRLLMRAITRPYLAPRYLWRRYCNAIS